MVVPRCFQNRISEPRHNGGVCLKDLLGGDCESRPHGAAPFRKRTIPDEGLDERVGLAAIGEGTQRGVFRAVPAKGRFNII